MSADVSALAKGSALPSRRVGPLTQTDVLRFAGASGDFNPLHWDPEVARHAGFEAPVLMGQYTAAMMAAWVSDRFGVERLRELEIRFVAPVIVGDTVTFGGVVDEVSGSGMLRLAIEAVTDAGVVARATVLVGD